MPEIKLVLTDLDGTVADFGKHVVSEKVREAVIACENRGVHMVPVTGRYYAMALPILEILGFEDLGVFDNGATIQNCKTGEVVWSQWLDAETVKYLARMLVPVSRVIDYSQEGDEHEPNGNEMTRIELVDESVSSVYSVVHKDDVELVTEQLQEVPGITFYWAASTNPTWTDYRGVQITHTLADKFHGVNALREITGVPMEQILAIGDGENDIALFRNAALKIAMGNATESLKSQADHIVGPVTADGFAEAMDRFVLKG